MAQLFHVTCIAHINKILIEDKYLKVTESNIGCPESLRPAADALSDAPLSYGDHVGPDVVWLTTDPSAVQSWGYNKDALVRWRKEEVLIVVEVPDEEVHSWNTWAFEHGISKEWYDLLNNKVDDASNWFVVERAIPQSEWKAVYSAKIGFAVWINPDKHPDLDPECHIDGIIKEHQRDKVGELYPMPKSYVASTLRGFV